MKSLSLLLTACLAGCSASNIDDPYIHRHDGYIAPAPVSIGPLNSDVTSSTTPIMLAPAPPQYPPPSTAPFPPAGLTTIDPVIPLQPYYQTTPAAPPNLYMNTNQYLLDPTLPYNRGTIITTPGGNTFYSNQPVHPPTSIQPYDFSHLTPGIQQPSIRYNPEQRR